MEYLLSRQQDEAAACVKELDCSLFHHEIVKRAVKVGKTDLLTLGVLKDAGGDANGFALSFVVLRDIGGHAKRMVLTFFLSEDGVDGAHWLAFTSGLRSVLAVMLVRVFVCGGQHK